MTPGVRIAPIVSGRWSKENESEENEQSLEELSDDQEADGLINQAEIDGKRTCRQATLRKLSHNI